MAEIQTFWCAIHQVYYYLLAGESGPALCLDCEGDKKHFDVLKDKEVYRCKRCGKELSWINFGAIQRHLKEKACGKNKDQARPKKV